MSLESEVADTNKISLEKQDENAQLKTEVSEKSSECARLSAENLS